MASTGVGNPITAVLLAYRAMDTMLEAIVLLLALIGVWSLAPDRVWGGRPGPRHNADPDGILAFVARVLPPIGIIVGIYIFWVGADHPGGKFQGATIVAAMWLLVMMAGLADAPPIGRRWLRVLLVAGPLVFIAVGLAGALTAGAFLAYPDGFAKPLIVVDRVRADAVARADARAASWPARRNGRPSHDRQRIERRDAVRDLCAAALVGVGALRPHRESAAAAQDPGVQRDRQRRVPAVRRHRAARRGGRHGRRSGAAGAADHRHRRRVLRDRARGHAAAAAVRGDRIDHARLRSAARPRQPAGASQERVSE